ncbi:hypothetical protein Agub_g2967 [Astrephomene gubernaculifera]|uniref:C3H1-type domain-containing protein n=1 Tax=Astrephomene gubernaculifera TaxID=47775 RepID=A0AAD3HI30_9CHLO|nr:hypothetical protein Agub_g2967 [Astrephomene gubernaculifera]
MAQQNESEVIGHYLIPAHGRPAQPLLHESTALFQDVVSDKLSTVESAIEADAGKLNQFFLILHWASDVKGGAGPSPENVDAGDAGAAAAKASVTVKQRTLLMIAAHAGSLRVLAYLLARGAEPSRKSPDGLTAYDMALAGESSQAPTALAMMRDADSHPSSSTRSSSTTEAHSFNGTDGLRNGTRQDLADSEGSSYSTTDLTRPEYSTDDFRMFNFKVLRCSKRHAHDWRACPFAHPTENARRRDPREFKYCALACPDYKQGFCIRGDVCPYAHGVFECWLHPSRYRTQLCKDGANCHRPVCFFAHSLPELRAPTYTWVPSPADLARPPMSQSAAGGGGAGAAAGNTAGTMSGTAAGAAGAGAVALNGGAGAVEGPGSPAAAVVAAGAEARTLMSQGSAGLPPTSGSLDGTPVALCGSPHTGNIANGNGNGLGSIVAANVTSPTASAAVGNGATAGSLSNCGSGPINVTVPPASIVVSKEGNANVTAAIAVVENGNCGRNDGKGCVVLSTSPGGTSFTDPSSASSGGAAGKVSLNLTQPNAAASMLGFTAPRMSNAFARRHGLNPKDNPMINLQKIALQSHQQPQQQNGMLGVSSHMGMGAAYNAQDNNPATTLRNHSSAASAGATLQAAAAAAGRGAGYNGNAGGQQRLQAAAAAAAVAAVAAGAGANSGGFAMPYSPPAGAAGAGSFGMGPMQMQMHAAASQLTGGAADSSLLAAQLAALGLQQQQQQQQHQRQQQHMGIGIGMGGINMANGAAAAAAAAAAGMGHGQVQYMTAAAMQPYGLMHPGMYGAGPNASMYDHSQQHLMAAMSGAQAEV